MIDTHAHMSSRVGGEFRVPEIDLVVLAGASLEDSQENVAMAKKSERILAAIGIHPQTPLNPPLRKGGNMIDEVMEKLEKMLQENREIIAVGECGLDFSLNPSESPLDRGDQEKIFRAQIELAEKYKKPLIIHARKAMDEVIEILVQYQVGGVIHCYTGGKKRVQKILNLPKDWYFGIDGNVTYEVGLAEVVKAIPQDRLVAETDSPELTPLPFRGQRNRPEYVKYVYEKIAEIWGVEFDKAEKILDGNARKLFGI